MESYKREFIEFLEKAGVLRFGDFTAKSGRKIPYFINAGDIKTGAQIATLENEFREYKRQQEDLVRTWSAAKTMISVIKLLGAIALALGAIYAVAKGIASHFIPFQTNGSTPP